MEQPNLVKTSLKLTKIKVINKPYLLDKDSNELYDYNLHKTQGYLKNIGKLKLNLEKNTRSIEFYNKNSIDNIKLSVKKKLDAVNQKKYIEFNEKEYEPGGPGYLRSLERFTNNQKTMSKHSNGGKTQRRKRTKIKKYNTKKKRKSNKKSKKHR